MLRYRYFASLAIWLVLVGLVLFVALIVTRVQFELLLAIVGVPELDLLG